MEINVFFLPLCMGNTARHIHPQNKLSTPGRIQEKGGPRENTHTHMGIRTREQRKFKKMGKKRYNSDDIGSFLHSRGMLCI